MNSSVTLKFVGRGAFVNRRKVGQEENCVSSREAVDGTKKREESKRGEIDKPGSKEAGETNRL